MVATLWSCGLSGLDGQKIRVEVDASMGLPSYDTVGLPDKAVTESRERVRAAIRNSGYVLPPRRVTVNLAPANLRKVGSVYDLPIALALMLALELIDVQRPLWLEESVFIGELALSGNLRPVTGVLSMALKAQEDGMKRFICPKGNAEEAACVEGLEVGAVENLAEIADILIGISQPQIQTGAPWSSAPSLAENDFSFIRGQLVAKRAAEIAAAGGHNLLMVGQPGGGKTMLARAMPGILPDLTFDEALEISRIHSLIGQLPDGLVRQRPFVSPHHGASVAALIGGGSQPKPGEISMAHLGVLFLDEMPEFSREVLEALRQPLEDGEVTISRVQASAHFPARFMLVGAMNPCPCGYFGSRYHKCNCSQRRIEQYRSCLSGPLMDRIDIFIWMQELDVDDYYKAGEAPAESSAKIRARVNAARHKQRMRLIDSAAHCNGQMNAKELEEYCQLSASAETLFAEEFRRQRFSGRARARILRLARTIADLDAADRIEDIHIAEALQYRQMDQIWG